MLHRTPRATRWPLVAAAALAAAFSSASVSAADVPDAALTGEVRTIDGETVDLASFAGSVVLVVNTASRCGYTPQYGPLQTLHETYAERGLAILGFPCNQFGKQEPGTEKEIRTFCETSYGVTFPMFEKVDVNGDDAAPLYRYLTSDRPAIADHGPVKWNFEKFLIDRRGKVIGRYRSGVAPDAKELATAIEKALADEVPAD